MEPTRKDVPAVLFISFSEASRMIGKSPKTARRWAELKGLTIVEFPSKVPALVRSEWMGLVESIIAAKR